MAERDIMTKCGICSENFNDPKLLPCFHSFCLKCLEKLAEAMNGAETFPCPVCRRDILVPSGGVSSFQNNFYVQVEDISSGSEQDCDACGINNSASHRCRQCQQNFCKSCTQTHLRMSSSSDHLLDSIVGQEKRKNRLKCFCNNHQSEEVTIVCMDCGDQICRVCETTTHNGHMLTSITTEASEKRKQLNELIDVSCDNLTDMEKDMRVVKRQADSKHTFFNEQIADLRKQKDVLISNINKEFISFEDQIKHLNDEQLMLSGELHENQKKIIANYKLIRDDVKEMVETGGDARLLRNFEDLVDKLQGIEVTLAPAVSGHNLMETVEVCTTWLIKLNEHTNSVPHKQKTNETFKS